MVCDNCQIRELTLVGTACVASLQIESVDGIAPIFAPADTGVSVQETVNFGDTPLNTVAEKVVRLLNTTPLPLRFEWRHLALPLENLPPTALRTVRPTGPEPPAPPGPPAPHATARRQRPRQVLCCDSRACAPPRLGQAPAAPLYSADLGEALEPDSTAFPFAISPPLGLMPPGEASDFVVSYRPSSFNLDCFAALLVPLDLPPEAMPGYDDDPTDDVDPALELGLRLVGRGQGRDLLSYPSALIGSDATKGEEVTLYPYPYPNPNPNPNPIPPRARR